MRSLEEATFIEIAKKLGVSKQGGQGIMNRDILRLQQRSRIDPRDNRLKLVRPLPLIPWRRFRLGKDSCRNTNYCAMVEVFVPVSLAGRSHL